MAQVKIPLCVPSITGNEIKNIESAIKDNWISGVGPHIEKFEKLASSYHNRSFAIATTNGTAALHVALLCAEVAENDEVLAPALSFIAPANAIRYLKAFPVFIDCDPNYWQLDPNAVVKFLTSECEFADGTTKNKKTGRRVKAIVVVHNLGHPADMQALSKIAEEYNLALIEDAAESLGAKCFHKRVGTFGKIAALSFNGNKIITTGGGGMLICSDEKIAFKARHLINQAKQGADEYVHDVVGYNYRLSNLLAAFGCAQMQSLGTFIEKKKEIAALYARELSGIGGILPMRQAPWAESTYWMYTVELETISPRFAVDFLAEHGIQSRRLWEPLNVSHAMKDCEQRPCPVAESIYKKGLSIPCSVTITESEQLEVISKLKLMTRTRHLQRPQAA